SADAEQAATDGRAHAKPGPLDARVAVEHPPLVAVDAELGLDLDGGIPSALGLEEVAGLHAHADRAFVHGLRAERRAGRPARIVAPSVQRDRELASDLREDLRLEPEPADADPELERQREDRELDVGVDVLEDLMVRVLLPVPLERDAALHELEVELHVP